VEVAKMTSTKLEIPYVDSGENNAYSLHEMMAITSLGQMEAVTREEVAEAVIQSAYGSTTHDILTALDKASLNPSYAAAVHRVKIFEKLKFLESKSKHPSIATNNLGPTVSKHLFELYILINATNTSVSNLSKTSPGDVLRKIAAYLEQNSGLVSYALTLGLPIIEEGNQILVLNNTLVPKNISHLSNLDEEALNKHVDEGWIDLRRKSIESWIKKLADLEYERVEITDKIFIPLERNWQNLSELNIGEILGYIYSMQGGNRKKELPI
jgi:hypothetical protein